MLIVLSVRVCMQLFVSPNRGRLFVGWLTVSDVNIELRTQGPSEKRGPPEVVKRAEGTNSTCVCACVHVAVLCLESVAAHQRD